MGEWRSISFDGSSELSTGEIDSPSTAKTLTVTGTFKLPRPGFAESSVVASVQYGPVTSPPNDPDRDTDVPFQSLKVVETPVSPGPYVVNGAASEKSRVNDLPVFAARLFRTSLSTAPRM